MSEARVADIFESIKPASMIGIKAAAARSRFISGVGVGTCVIFVISVSYQWQPRVAKKGYPNDTGLGQEHGLERPSARRRVEPHRLQKRNFPL